MIDACVSYDDEEPFHANGNGVNEFIRQDKLLRSLLRTTFPDAMPY